MFKKLLLLFILVPLAELYLLIKIGEYLGAEITIGLIVLTGILGAIFVRLEGFTLIKKLKRELSEGELPHKRLMEGICILAAGLLLLTPGLLTDLIGFLLLIPPIRIRLINHILAKLKEFIREKGEIRVNFDYHRKFPEP